MDLKYKKIYAKVLHVVKKTFLKKVKDFLKKYWTNLIFYANINNCHYKNFKKKNKNSS